MKPSTIFLITAPIMTAMIIIWNPDNAPTPIPIGLILAFLAMIVLLWFTLRKGEDALLAMKCYDLAGERWESVYNFIK